MKKLFILLFFLSSEVLADEVVKVSPRECVEYALVQFDAKDALDKGQKYTYPKKMPLQLQLSMAKVTEREDNKEYDPLTIGHAFLDFCMMHDGQFIVPDKI